MVDIALCPGGKCPLKKDCYRYRAYPDFVQSYFDSTPNKDKTCKYFMPFDKNKDRVRMIENIREIE